jgi:hypothetical protein
MAEQRPHRAHVITGGFPPGSPAGHDHDHARLVLLGLLAEAKATASVANDFGDLAKWLPLSRLLITYVAGPYPDVTQCGVLRDWLADGGHWLGLHGTSGGRAERVDGVRQRRTVKTEHHAVLGSFFLTHPPICDIQVDVVADHPVTRGLGASFLVRDEPYFIELQDPGATQVLLTASYGASGTWPVVETLYGTDTSLGADGRTRVLGYTRPVGRGAGTYFALGHCHDPSSRPGRGDDGTPETFRGAWDSGAFTTLLRNTIGWGLGGAR